MYISQNDIVFYQNFQACVFNELNIPKVWIILNWALFRLIWTDFEFKFK